MPKPDPNDSDILSVHSGVHADSPAIPPGPPVVPPGPPIPPILPPVVRGNTIPVELQDDISTDDWNFGDIDDDSDLLSVHTVYLLDSDTDTDVDSNLDDDDDIVSEHSLNHVYDV
jgi:hypothetical protein